MRTVAPKNFLAELKRRNVYKVVVAYAIVGWLSIQIATQVFNLLNVFLCSLPYGWMQSPPVSRGHSLSFEECLLKMTLPFGILAVVLLAGCGEEKKAVELPPPVVTVTAAVQREVKDWDEYTGRLAPLGTVEVRPKVSGYLTEVKFDDGDMVKKGQVMFVIDPRPYQADQDRA
ncbi:MAG: hypothetical protein DMF37_08995, partial [Verrucomicrobia bacterium]